MKIKHLTISHTSLNAWRNSPRQFLYEYVYGLVPKRRNEKTETGFGSALDFGIAVHRFEELRKSDSDNLVLATQIAQESTLPDRGTRSKEHLIKLLQLYAQKHPFTFGQNEVELSFPLTPRVTYVAHIDKITSDLELIDLKTTSKHLAWDWLPTIAPNGQAMGYILAAKLNGMPEITGLTFRGISTDPKLLDSEYRPKKRSGGYGDRPPLFMDFRYEPQPHEIKEWYEALVNDAEKLLQDLDQMSARTLTCSCGIGDYCNYRTLCLTSPEERDIVMRNCYDSKDFRGFKIEWEGQ